MSELNCQDCLPEKCFYRDRLECCEYRCLSDDNDDALDEYLEMRRNEFRNEWFDYVDDKRLALDDMSPVTICSEVNRTA